ELEKIQKDAEELSVTVNTISALLARNVEFSEMLTEIGSVMPSGAVLTGLQFSIEDLESPLVISAQLDTEERAAVLRNNLASSNLFHKAEIKSIKLLEDEEPSGTGTSGGSTITPAPQQPTTTLAPAAPSPYKYTVTIDAYFKELPGAKL